MPVRDLRDRVSVGFSCAVVLLPLYFQHEKVRSLTDTSALGLFPRLRFGATRFGSMKDDHLSAFDRVQLKAG